MKETFLVIDTETTKEGYNMPNQSVFDIGWAISNRQGEILQTRSYMVEEFRLQALEKKKAFLIDSEVVDKATYITKLLNKEMKVVNWKSIIAQLTKDMNKYNVEFVSAYNLGFDFVGCEIDKDYFKAQEERFAAHTAQCSLFAGAVE